MFCIIKDNTVIAGPNYWSKIRFEHILSEDCGINISLPDSSTQPIMIDDSVKILPVIEHNIPDYNTKTHQLVGPIYTITDESISLDYTTTEKSVEVVQNELKAQVTNNRWISENAGILVTIQGVDVKVDTDRTKRDIFSQLLLNMSDVVDWKFGNNWIQITKQDVQLISSSIFNHVQNTFKWEKDKHLEIESCTTLTQLNDVILTYGN